MTLVRQNKNTHQKFPRITWFHNILSTDMTSRHGCSKHRSIECAAKPRGLCIHGHQQQLNESVLQVIICIIAHLGLREGRSLYYWVAIEGIILFRRTWRTKTNPTALHHHPSSPTITPHHERFVFLDMPNKGRGITLIMICCGYLPTYLVCS